MSHLLTILLALPATGSLIVLMLPVRKLVRWTALAITLCAVVAALVVLVRFDRHATDTDAPIDQRAAHHGMMQMVERVTWIPSLHIHYQVGVDGISLPLILLTVFLFPLAAATSWNIQKWPRSHFALLLILETAILGAFVSLDLFLFFLAVEVSLACIYLLVGGWGRSRRKSALVRFFLYMLAGSIAYLIAGSLLFANTHSCDIVQLPSLLAGSFGNHGTHWRLAIGLFVLLSFAMGVRIPVVPLHTWALDLQPEAPAAASMILAGLFTNIAAYAMLRIVYSFFPDAARHVWLLAALPGAGGIVYGSLCGIVQNDLKRVLAYSSISQMGFVLLGIATLTPAGMNGAIFMMIANGLSSPMLFFTADVLADRAKHNDIAGLGGLALVMPRLWGLSSIGFFAALGTPGLCGFVGQILVVLGVFQTMRPEAILFAPGIVFRIRIYLLVFLALIGFVLTAALMLRTMQRVFLGPPHPQPKDFQEIDTRETSIFALLAAASILLGILPTLCVFSLTGKTTDGFFSRFDRPPAVPQTADFRD